MSHEPIIDPLDGKPIIDPLTGEEMEWGIGSAAISASPWTVARMAWEYVKGIKIEFEMLQAFYQSWEAMHAVPNDKLHRGKKEAAAQLMVDNAHTLRRWYETEKAH